MLAAATVSSSAETDPRALLTLLPLAGLSLAAYGFWVSRLRARGGRVSGEHMLPWDLVATILLGLGFGALAYLGFQQAAREPMELSVFALLIDTAFKTVVLAGLVAFLAYRKVGVVVRFGLREASLWRVVSQATLFLGAALPGILGLLALTSTFGSAHEEQQIVTFFRSQARNHDSRGLLAVFFTASIMAPFWEEFIFRGYFYATLKRYVGPVASALLVSALFALSHANVASLSGLFALALCLTVAYEWTGSLLVPMAMHALFNTLGLAVMYWQSTRALP